MKAILVGMLMALVVGITTPALSQNAFNGTKVGFSSTTALSFTAGTNNVDGSENNSAARTVAIGKIEALYDSTTCGGPGGGTAWPHPIVASSVYYVYVDNWGAIWESLIAPSSVGRPNFSNGLSAYSCNVNQTTQGCCIAMTAADFAFIGSYLTDSGSLVIPFTREGNEVHIYPSQSTASSLPSYQQTGWWIPKGAGVQTNKWTFSPFPTSASAAIIDFYTWTQDATNLSALIEDPFGLGVAGNTIYPQAFLTINTYTNTGNLDHLQVRVALDSTNSFTIWMPAGNADQFKGAINPALKGYVENILSPGR